MSTAPKKTHRFLVDALPDSDTGIISDARIVHQIARVLALTEGEEIALFADGSDDVVVRIESIERDRIAYRIVRTVPALPAPRTALIAAVSIPKRDVFELIVQKLTELGVSEVVPIRSGRTVKQSVRLDRLQAISDEATEQCGGNRRVTIHEPMELAACLAAFELPSVVFDASGKPLQENKGTSCMIYIGPEGGWSEQDRAQFESAHAQFVTLGPRTLRTETAAITAAFKLLWN